MPRIRRIHPSHQPRHLVEAFHVFASGRLLPRIYDTEIPHIIGRQLEFSEHTYVNDARRRELCRRRLSSRSTRPTRASPGDRRRPKTMKPTPHEPMPVAICCFSHPRTLTERAMYHLLHIHHAHCNMFIFFSQLHSRSTHHELSTLLTLLRFTHYTRRWTCLHDSLCTKRFTKSITYPSIYYRPKVLSI